MSEILPYTQDLLISLARLSCAEQLKGSCATGEFVFFTGLAVCQRQLFCLFLPPVSK